MARVTVEDCIDKVANQFELTTVAAKRARQLVRGADPRVAWGNHKSTVVALREIADGHVGPEVLEEEELPLNLQPAVSLPPLDLGGDI